MLWLNTNAWPTLGLVAMKGSFASALCPGSRLNTVGSKTQANNTATAAVAPGNMVECFAPYACGPEARGAQRQTQQNMTIAAFTNPNTVENSHVP